MGEHALNQGFAADKLATQKNHTKNPVDQRGFPFQECFITQQNSHTAENDQRRDREDLALFKGFLLIPKQAVNDDRREDQHRCSTNDATELKGVAQ